MQGPLEGSLCAMYPLTNVRVYLLPLFAVLRCVFVLMMDACRDLRGFVRSVRSDEGLVALSEGDREGQQLARSGLGQVLSGFAL